MPVFAIRDEADLRATLAELRMRHLVLIDTVGMSQRDRRLADQVALLAGGGSRVRRVLLLSAVAQASVLDDVARAYRGAELAGCILTKVDEALMLGSALDVLVRHRLTAALRHERPARARRSASAQSAVPGGARLSRCAAACRGR